MGLGFGSEWTEEGPRRAAQAFDGVGSIKTLQSLEQPGPSTTVVTHRLSDEDVERIADAVVRRLDLTNRRSR